MFVILIPISMSDPNVTSGLSAVRLSVNFGIFELACATSRFAGAINVEGDAISSENFGG
jgi:hypothetical protein